jgi:hypothetical protein
MSVGLILLSAAVIIPLAIRLMVGLENAGSNTGTNAGSNARVKRAR